MNSLEDRVFTAISADDADSLISILDEKETVKLSGVLFREAYLFASRYKKGACIAVLDKHKDVTFPIASSMIFAAQCDSLSPLKVIHDQEPEAYVNCLRDLIASRRKSNKHKDIDFLNFLLVCSAKSFLSLMEEPDCYNDESEYLFAQVNIQSRNLKSKAQVIFPAVYDAYKQLRGGPKLKALLFTAIIGAYSLPRSTCKAFEDVKREIATMDMDPDSIQWAVKTLFSIVSSEDEARSQSILNIIYLIVAHRSVKGPLSLIIINDFLNACDPYPQGLDPLVIKVIQDNAGDDDFFIFNFSISTIVKESLKAASSDIFKLLAKEYSLLIDKEPKYCKDHIGAVKDAITSLHLRRAYVIEWMEVYSHVASICDGRIHNEMLGLTDLDSKSERAGIWLNNAIHSNKPALYYGTNHLLSQLPLKMAMQKHIPHNHITLHWLSRQHSFHDMLKHAQTDEVRSEILSLMTDT